MRVELVARVLRRVVTGGVVDQYGRSRPAPPSTCSRRVASRQNTHHTSVHRKINSLLFCSKQPSPLTAITINNCYYLPQKNVSVRKLAGFKLKSNGDLNVLV